MSRDPEAPVQGFVAEGFAPVRDAFTAVVEASEGTGAAVAAWHDGRWVVDLWGGFADAARTRPWERNSLVMPYSATKPFAAVAVLRLVDRRLVELDAPVSTYWPGFVAPATVRHILDHTAGIVVLDEPLPTEALYDPARMEAALAAQPPRWEPGTALGEAALVYGHLLGAIVRRVDGRTIGAFLRDEVTGPHAIDFHVGLRPDEEARAVELTGFEAGGRFLADLETYGPLLRPAIDNPPGAVDPAVVNGSAWRRAEIAAANGHGTARGLAGLYVELARGGLLSDGVLAEMTRIQASGHDDLIGDDAAWGLGVAIDGDGFGMGGLGGSYGWWSSAGGYAFAFVTGHLGDPDRGDRIEAVLREVLGLATA